MKRNSKPIDILIVLVIAITSFGSFKYIEKDNLWKTGQRKVKDYTYVEPYGATCMAISPGCGVCFGERVDRECLVTQEEYIKYKKLYPSLEVE